MQLYTCIDKYPDFPETQGLCKPPKFPLDLQDEEKSNPFSQGNYNAEISIGICKFVKQGADKFAANTTSHSI